jgi:hypothetical protein
VREAHSEPDNEVAFCNELTRNRRSKPAADAERPGMVCEQPVTADGCRQQRAGAIRESTDCILSSCHHGAAPSNENGAARHDERARQLTDALWIGVYWPW